MKIGGSFFRRKPCVSDEQYPNPVVNQGSACFEVNNWIISDFVMRVLIPVVGVHPFPLNELMLMTSAVCRFKPTHLFEWGTHIGTSARVFYEAARAFNVKVEIHSIDLPDLVDHVEHPHERRGMLVHGIDGVVLHQGDGLSVSIDILSAVPSPNRPLFFLDGDHTYESVKRELDAVTASCPDTSILVHDTFFQSEDSGYNVGPYLAVKETLENSPNKYVSIVENTGLPGMTLLYPLRSPNPLART
jgi:cephalosporin hydroxylase